VTENLLVKNVIIVDELITKDTQYYFRITTDIPGFNWFNY